MGANGDEAAYAAFMALSKGFFIDGPTELAELAQYIITHPKSSAKAVAEAVKNIPGALADIPNIPAHVEAYIKELSNSELSPEEQTEILFRTLGSWGFKAMPFTKVASKAANAVKVTKTAQSVVNVGSRVLKPLGLGSTGRTIARNLAEKLAMEEIMVNPLGGQIIPRMKPLTDSRWSGWRKMQFEHIGLDGSKTVIHYNGKWVDGVLKAVDDFKFK